MKVFISQPMYLPWPGQFDQIRHADVFVHYDDVQLPQGRSFCNRVQIKTEDDISWLSVPLVKNSRGLINEALIDNSQDWKTKHLNKIRESLSKCRFYEDAAGLIQAVFDQEIVYLSDLNIIFIEAVAQYLGLKTQFHRASNLGLNTRSTERLIEICKVYNADCYITGHGARNYLNHELFELENMSVHYMNYEIVPYPQFGTFTPYVTILDLIAHTGREALSHLQSTTSSWREFLKNE